MNLLRSNMNKVAIIAIILLAVVMYGLTLRGAKGNPRPDNVMQLQGASNSFELSPERGRFAHVMSLADFKSYSLTRELADFVFPDVGYYKGRFYSYFAPGISYMAVPFYLAGKAMGVSQVATFSLVSLVAILNLVVLFRIARDIIKLPVWASMFAVMAFAFGSIAWSYAISLYQHHFTTLFMLLGFYSVWRYKNSQKFGWVWGSVVWACYGLAITVDYPNVILLLPVMVYFLASSIKTTSMGPKVNFNFRTTIITSSLLFILVTGWHLHHNASNFGSWKNLAGNLMGYKTILENHLLDQPDPQKAIEEYLPKKDYIKFFDEQAVPYGFKTLLFSSERGLFFYSPIFILALFGIVMALRKPNMETSVLLSLVGVNLLLYSSWGDPWGGWAYGSRYLIPSMAMLSLFIGIFIGTPTKFGLTKRLVAVPLFAYSCAIALLGALTTNSLPPKVEAVPLHVPYTYAYNWHLLLQGHSGSFFYRSLVDGHMPLLFFGFVIFIPLCLIASLLLLIPRHEP